MSDETNTSREIPVVWVESDDPRAAWTNQFVSTYQPDEFIVTSAESTWSSAGTTRLR